VRAANAAASRLAHFLPNMLVLPFCVHIVQMPSLTFSMPSLP
jgi:hypothetical protein